MQTRTTCCGWEWSGWERLFLGLLFLDLRLLWMNIWIGVNGPLGGFIREVDWIRQGCEISGVTTIAGDRTWGELTPESLLVVLTRFPGSGTGAVPRGSIGDGMESSIPGFSELFNFWIRSSMNLSWKSSWRLSISRNTSMIWSRVLTFRIVLD